MPSTPNRMSKYTGRYALTPEAYKDLKLDLRRLLRAAQGLQKLGPAPLPEKMLSDFLGEVERLSERGLRSLKDDVRQIK